MILICNNPDGVAATLDELPDVTNPISQARLVMLRPQVDSGHADELVGSEIWQESTALLAAAVERPSLKLDG